MLVDGMSLMGRAGGSPPRSSFEARALARVDRALGRALLSSVTRYAALHAHGSRALDGGRRFIEGFAARALTLDERASLGRTLYGRRSKTGRGALFPWEDAWYRAALPAAPAKVLLGGCGAGREAVALLERGYTVLASEPATALFESAARRLAGRARVWPLGYEEWVETDGQRAAPARDLFGAAPFDAVILGWTSVSHVLDDEVRDRLFEKLCACCPRGPILFSYFSAPEQPAPERERAKRLGDVMGRALGRWRALAQRATNERFLPHAGFVRFYRQSEIAELARVYGRSAEFGLAARGSAHCTLRVG